MSSNPRGEAGAPTDLKPLEVLILGRLTSRRRIQTKEGVRYLHIIRCPAPDSYSYPTTVEVSAPSSLGERDADVRVKCRIGGAPRSYNTTDKETGESFSVQTADMRLYTVD